MINYLILADEKKKKKKMVEEQVEVVDVSQKKFPKSYVWGAKNSKFKKKK